MSAVRPFAFPATGQQIRTVLINGEPWFILADAAKILRYRDAEHASRLIRDHQLNTLPRGIAAELGQRGGRPPKIVTEGGLYRLIVRSDAPLAEPFQDWVTDEVLPTIRRTGAYTRARRYEIPQTYAEALELAARQARKLEAATAENARLKVKAEAFDAWINGTGCYLVGTVAKMLGLGPNTLFDFLYGEKILIKSPGSKRHREPYATSATAGWFELKAVPPERANGHATKTTYITPYGAQRIRHLLINRGLLPAQQRAVTGGDPSGPPAGRAEGVAVEHPR